MNLQEVGTLDVELVEQVILALNEEDPDAAYAYRKAEKFSGKQNLRTAVVFRQQRLLLEEEPSPLEAEKSGVVAQFGIASKFTDKANG